jgi:hypothetical protein
MPIQYKLIAWLLIYLAGVASGSFVVHKMDMASYNKLKADYAQAEVAAAKIEWDKQREADQAASAAVAARAASQERLAGALQQRLAEVQRHEKTLMRGCVTYDFVRQLRLYIRNLPGESLAFPSGKSGGDCAPISGLQLGRAIITNLAIGRDNADRYNQLSAWARSIEAMRPTSKGDAK